MLVSLRRISSYCAIVMLLSCTREREPDIMYCPVLRTPKDTKQFCMTIMDHKCGDKGYIINLLFEPDFVWARCLEGGFTEGGLTDGSHQESEK